MTTTNKVKKKSPSVKVAKNLKKNNTLTKKTFYDNKPAAKQKLEMVERPNFVKYSNADFFDGLINSFVAFICINLALVATIICAYNESELAFIICSFLALTISIFQTFQTGKIIFKNYSN